jgi:hypothetical protein
VARVKQEETITAAMLEHQRLRNECRKAAEALAAANTAHARANGYELAPHGGGWEFEALLAEWGGGSIRRIQTKVIEDPFQFRLLWQTWVDAEMLRAWRVGNKCAEEALGDA